jgi:protein-S-isoprenylcysteine O-methyltransferase Ste14
MITSLTTCRALIVVEESACPFWPLMGRRRYECATTLSAVLLAGWFEWAMRRADTPTNPYKPVSHIATEGPFRYTRNPTYLSMTMMYTVI